MEKRIYRVVRAPSTPPPPLPAPLTLLPTLKQVILGADAICKICLQLSRPGQSQTIFLSQVNKAFNIKLQIEFAFGHFGAKPHTIFVMTDTDMRFTEAVLVTHMIVECIVKNLVHVWVYRHGAPSSLFVDDEPQKGTIL